MRTSPTQVFTRLTRTDPPAHPTRLVDTAVVLGGSIAGLLAARVLADYATSVLIVERDAPADAARRGVPQAMQIHVLLPAGREQLERWFPGFCEHAVALGAVLARPDQIAAFSDGVQQVTAANGMFLSCSRPFLERQIREHTLARPEVRLVTGRATGVDISAGAVSCVRYLVDGVEHRQPANLAVDAMGRASKLGDWLERAGWQRPPLRRVPTEVNYATGYFRREPGDPPTANAVARMSPGRSDRISTGVVTAIEDDRWQILLAGYGEDRPGRDADEFVARCKTELPPVFGEAAGGERIGEITAYHQADSRRRDYPLIPLPARLVSVGDAVASFNPIYGQGLSSATLHAVCLAEFLGSGAPLDEPARPFFALQRVVVDAAWEMSTVADKARHRVPVPWRERLRNLIRAQVVAAAETDPVIARRFHAVTSMLEHPAVLMRPGIVLRALVVNAFARLGRKRRHRRRG